MISLGKRQRQIETMDQRDNNNIDKLLVDINTSILDSSKANNNKGKKMKLLLLQKQSVNDNVNDIDDNDNDNDDSDSDSFTGNGIKMLLNSSFHRTVTPNHSPRIVKVMIDESCNIMIPNTTRNDNDNDNDKQNIPKSNTCNDVTIEVRTSVNVDGDDEDMEECDVSFDDTPLAFDENLWDEELHLNLLQSFASRWLEKYPTIDYSESL